MPPPAVPVVGRPARLAAAAAAVGMPAVAALAEAPAAVWEGRVRRPAAWEDRLPLRAGGGGAGGAVPEGASSTPSKGGTAGSADIATSVDAGGESPSAGNGGSNNQPASGGTGGSSNQPASGGTVTPDARTPDAPPDGSTPDAPGTCSTDKDCSSQMPICLGHQCAKCAGDSDCAGRSGAPACATSSGLCVACTANRHCTGAANTCDTATNQCVGCVTRSDCAGECQTCTGRVCKAVKSQDDPGVCAGTCDSTGACKSKQGQTCETAGGGCAAGTTCAPDGVCCDSACGQACHSCLGSKTGGKDGVCGTVSDGASCGSSGEYCSAGTCKGGCFISGAFYASGAVDSANSCLTCQASSSSTSWTPLGNGTSCGTGQVCSGGNCQTGCWIGGAFVGNGVTKAGNTCQACNSAKSSSAWSNNDGATVSCGSCPGATASCTNGAAGTCNKNPITYWWDGDHDGYGDPTLASTTACDPPAGYVPNSGDCDGSDPSIFPGWVGCGVVVGGGTSAVLTCQSNGTYARTPCPYGCVNTQCRIFATVGVSGTVTCGSTSCSTSVGCSLPDNPHSPPVCGATSTTTALCDGPNDCPAGQLCCHVAATNSTSQSCVNSYGSPLCYSPPTPGVYITTVCDPSLSEPCPSGMTCTQLEAGDGALSSYICE